MKYYKKCGFTIIESIFYVGFVCVIFLMLLQFYRAYYNGYNNARRENIEINNIRNFYINLDEIIKDEDIENIYVNNNALYITQKRDEEYLNKAIKYYDRNVVVKFTSNNKTLTITKMLYDIEDFKVVQKEKLIYIYIKASSGKEYVRCI